MRVKNASGFAAATARRNAARDALNIGAGRPAMFNRTEILRKAWADYRIRRLGVFAAGDENGRRFIRAIFAKALTAAWAEAKTKAAAATRALEADETARRFVTAQQMGD